MSEDNKQLVRDWIGAINAKNPDALVRPWAKDFVIHVGAGIGEVRGPTRITEVIRKFWAAIPDMNVTIDDLVAEGDRVAGRVTVTGTHQGEVWGVAATGKKVEFPGFAIWRCTNEGIAEQWILDDLLTFMTQIGAVSSPILSGGTRRQEEALPMSALVIATVEIHDPEGIQEYIHAVGPTHDLYGGLAVGFDNNPETLEGTWPGTRTMVLGFDSVEAAHAWYKSPEYQAAAKIRQRSAKTTMVLVKTPTGNR